LTCEPFCETSFHTFFFKSLNNSEHFIEADLCGTTKVNNYLLSRVGCFNKFRFTPPQIMQTYMGINTEECYTRQD
jgi:hypothetical protein